MHLSAAYRSCINCVRIRPVIPAIAYPCLDDEAIFLAIGKTSCCEAVFHRVAEFVVAAVYIAVNHIIISALDLIPGERYLAAAGNSTDILRLERDNVDEEMVAPLKITYLFTCGAHYAVGINVEWFYVIVNAGYLLFFLFVRKADAICQDSQGLAERNALVKPYIGFLSLEPDTQCVHECIRAGSEAVGVVWQGTAAHALVFFHELIVGHRAVI